MLERFNKWLDLLESRISLWQFVWPLVGGTVTGLLSHTVEWINRFGAFGWWVSFLCGATLTGAALFLAESIRIKRMQRRKLGEWTVATDNINPLDSTFQHKRINIYDLVHPYTKRISDKKFTDCEIVGPANIVMLGHGSIMNIQFMGCDFIPTKPGDFHIENAIGLENVHINGGALINMTLYLSPEMLNVIENSGPEICYISLTGNEEIDNRSPASIAQKRQQ